ncbi:MAG: nucleotidyl transferase AbiEii/AbiGii toxin family protein [Prolixibacteraceae bacterium]
MLKNTQINRITTVKIAKALGELNLRVLYVGGAVVSLYIDDPSAEDVRPTKDIDLSLEIASLGELESLRQELYNKGFSQSHEDNVVCRFRYEDIKVDVMGTKPIGWAPANPWFEKGFPYKKRIKLDTTEIFILPLPYFLATKFTAFNDRGKKDPRTSHDFEDIVYLLNYTSKLSEEINATSLVLKSYLKEEFQNILDSEIMQEAILANLFYEEQDIRFNLIISKLKEMITLI